MSLIKRTPLCLQRWKINFYNLYRTMWRLHKDRHHDVRDEIKFLIKCYSPVDGRKKKQSRRSLSEFLSQRARQRRKKDTKKNNETKISISRHNKVKDDSSPSLVRHGDDGMNCFDWKRRFLSIFTYILSVPALDECEGVHFSLGDSW